MILLKHSVVSFCSHFVPCLSFSTVDFVKSHRHLGLVLARCRFCQELRDIGFHSGARCCSLKPARIERRVGRLLVINLEMYGTYSVRSKILVQVRSYFTFGSDTMNWVLTFRL